MIGNPSFPPFHFFDCSVSLTLGFSLFRSLSTALIYIPYNSLNSLPHRSLGEFIYSLAQTDCFYSFLSFFILFLDQNLNVYHQLIRYHIFHIRTLRTYTDAT